MSNETNPEYIDLIDRSKTDWFTDPADYDDDSSSNDIHNVNDSSVDSSVENNSSYQPMVYVMNNMREDGYYHFAAYEPGTEIDKISNTPKDSKAMPLVIGWGLFTDQLPEEQPAWIEGVQRYQKYLHVLTTRDAIHKWINEIKLKFSLDEAKFQKNKSLIMPQISTVLKLLDEMQINDPSKCNDEYLSNLRKLGIMELPTLKNQFRYAWLTTKFNLNNDLDKLIYSEKALLGSYITPVLNMGDQMCETFFGTVDATYVEIRRICGDAIRIWNECVREFNTARNNVPDSIKRRKEFWTKFIETCKKLVKKYGHKIIDHLYLGIAVDIIAETFKKLFLFHSKDVKSWKVIFNKLKLLISKSFKQFKSSIIPKFQAILKSLMPAIASYLGALSASICSDQAKKEIDQRRILNANDSSSLEDFNNKLKNDDLNKLKNVKSVIIDKASNLEDNLSLSFNQQKTINQLLVQNNSSIDIDSSYDTSLTNNNDDNSVDKINHICKVSMCDNYNNSDSSIIPFNENAYLEPETYIVELDKELSHNFIKNISKFKVGDTIGNLSKCPIKAIRDSSVIELGENYIICNYTKPNNLDELEGSDENNITTIASNYLNESLSALNNTNEMDSISSSLKKQYNIENFIINYISYFRFADLASYTRKYSDSNVNDVTSDEFIKIYEDNADKLFNSFQKKIKKIAGKDNVYSKSKAGQILTLKNEIDDCKYDFIKNIINLYTSNPGNLKFCSKGRIADYSLHDMYLSYLNDIDYDEDNPYVVKLVSLLEEFIAKRRKIEINLNNIDSLVISFNELCDKTIKKFWTAEKSSYYKELCKLYVTNKENIISTSIYDGVLEYLKKLTNYSTFTREYTISIGNDSDINKLLNEQSKKSENDSYDKEQLELLNNLKKIAIRFASIVEIEKSMNSYEYTNAAEIINALSKKGTSDYYENKKYTQKDLGLFGLENILSNYLKTIREQTEYESKQLTALVKSCISDYNSLDNTKLFESYREVSWPTPSVVYRNNKKCDFYFLTLNNVQVSEKNLKDIESEISEDINKDIPENSFYDPTSSTDMTSYKYWLRYMCIATSIHCMMPNYWSTGLVIKGVPILMPVIYIPICVIKTKRVITVIGTGVCGISISPMLLFCNVSGIKMSLLPVINKKIESFADSITQMTNEPVKKISEYCTEAINSLDKQIEDEILQLSDIDYQISEIGKIKKPTLGIYKLHLALGEDATFKRLYFTNDRFNSRERQTDFDENYSQSDITTADDIDVTASVESTIEELSKIQFSLESEEDKRYQEYLFGKALQTSSGSRSNSSSSSGEETSSSGDSEDDMMNDNYVPGKKNFKVKAVTRGGGYGDGGYGPSVSLAGGSSVVVNNTFELFARYCWSWEGGYVDDPSDHGGATQRGITFTTYSNYCSRKGIKNNYTKDTYKTFRMTDEWWYEIMGTLFWNPSHCDKIDDAYIATICCRAYMASGHTRLITYLNTTYGKGKSNTVISMNAVNRINNMSSNQRINLFKQLWSLFDKQYRAAATVGDNAKYLNGWLRSLRALNYGKLGLNTVPVQWVSL